MRLVEASLEPPAGLRDLLDDLGDGEGGFGGTGVASGAVTIEDFLQRCVHMTDPEKLEPGYVPQTVFFAVDDADRAVGMARVRHWIDEKLRVHGGHIGYYVHSAERGKGYGTEMLGLALRELRRLGEPKALITVDGNNTRSRRVAEVNGGRLEEEGAGPPTDGSYVRYWIDLEEMA